MPIAGRRWHREWVGTWRTAEAGREWTFRHPWIAALVFGVIITAPMAVWFLVATGNVAALVGATALAFPTCVVAMGLMFKRNALAAGRS